MAYKPLSEKYFIGFGVNAEFKGDYRGFASFNAKYLVFTNSLFFGIKPKPNLEYGFGIAYKYDMGYHSVYPAFLYNHTFHKKWGIEAYLPSKAFLRYSVTRSTNLLAGISGKSTRYHIGGGEVADALILKQTEIRYGLRLEQEVLPILGFSFDAGYRQYLTLHFSEVGASKSDHLIDTNPKGSIYANFSIFLKPPSKK
jgi:hypothetical protein